MDRHIKEDVNNMETEVFIHILIHTKPHIVTAVITPQLDLEIAVLSVKNNYQRFKNCKQEAN